VSVVAQPLFEEMSDSDHNNIIFYYRCSDKVKDVHALHLAGVLHVPTPALHNAKHMHT
jgi:hypothetical protein